MTLWFLFLAAAVALAFLIWGCSPAQQRQAVVLHDAACVPTLLAFAEFTKAAKAQGIEPLAAAQSICAVPTLSAELVAATRDGVAVDAMIDDADGGAP
jgi:hypothetical protein